MYKPPHFPENEPRTDKSKTMPHYNYLRTTHTRHLSNCKLVGLSMPLSPVPGNVIFIRRNLGTESLYNDLDCGKKRKKKKDKWCCLHCNRCQLYL